MIDIHIVYTKQYDSREDLDVLLAQLEPEPVIVHVIENNNGREGLGQARMRGYTSGSDPFVTYCDPDDAIVPGAFKKLTSAIKAFPDVKYFGCNECIERDLFQTWHSIYRTAIPLNCLHHLQCISKDLANAPSVNQAEWFNDPDLVGQEFFRYANIISELGEFVYLDLPLYVWNRNNPNSFSRKSPTIVRFGALQHQLLEANPAITILGEKDFTGDALTGSGETLRLRDLPVFKLTNTRPKVLKRRLPLAR